LKDDETKITFKWKDFKRFLEHFELTQKYKDHGMGIDVMSCARRPRFVFSEDEKECGEIPFEEEK